LLSGLGKLLIQRAQQGTVRARNGQVKRINAAQIKLVMIREVGGVQEGGSGHRQYLEDLVTLILVTRKLVIM
jgi:hypothetical protein